jgi:hypothetical protein
VDRYTPFPIMILEHQRIVHANPRASLRWRVCHVIIPFIFNAG